MASLMPNGKQQYINASGSPIAGGKVYTYAAGTSTPKATYTTAAAAVANANPVILDARGEAAIFWDGAYKVSVYDASDVLVYTTDNYVALINAVDLASTANGKGASGVGIEDAAGKYTSTNVEGALAAVATTAELAASSGASLLGFLQSGTSAVARTAQAKLRDTISVKDFGAVGDGVTDDTAAIQAAATAAAGKALYVPGVATHYLVTDKITVPVNTRVFGDGGGSHIRSSNAAASILYVSNGVRGSFEDLKLSYTTASATAYVGGVHLSSSSGYTVYGCDFESMIWAGVYLDSSNNNTVENNYIHDSIGTAQDSSDICVYRDSNYNVIHNNRCYGGTGAWHGIQVLGPVGTVPYYNKITANKVGAHSCYGILHYLVTAANTSTLIDGNTVENVAGTSLGGESGAGIYVLGAGAVDVTNNQVLNCCASTSVYSGSLHPAGIAVAADATGLLPCIVTDNTVRMAKWWGINISGHEAIISDNTVHIEEASRYGIYAVNSSNTTISGNRISMLSTLSSKHIYVTGTTASVTDVVIAGNILRGGDETALGTFGSGDYTVSAAITSNRIGGGGSTRIPMLLDKLADSAIVGNTCDGATHCFYITTAVRTRVSANTFKSGVYAIYTGGTCDDVYIDSSNQLTGVILSEAAGVTVATRATAAPSGGGTTRQVGDRVEMSAPVVGQPKGWRCTVAGSPGTWVSEGNL